MTPIHLCLGRIYRFEGHLIELTIGAGPWPLRRDGEPKRQTTYLDGERIDRFMALTAEQREGLREV